MAFYVGQKVVCVDDEDTNASGIQELQEGRIYTVLRVSRDTGDYPPGPPRLRSSGYVVWLAEIEVRPAVGNPDCPFSAGRFRPVVDRKTDITVFTDMLNPSREEISA